jgi:hypothetical protein
MGEKPHQCLLTARAICWVAPVIARRAASVIMDQARSPDTILHMFMTAGMLRCGFFVTALFATEGLMIRRCLRPGLSGAQHAHPGAAVDFAGALRHLDRGDRVPDPDWHH